jgi:iron complex transport system substrate-binding protein
VSALPGAPRVISLEPQTLSAVLDSILLVGRVCGVLRQATEVVTGLQERLTRIQEVTSGIDRIRVLTLEWLDPPFVGGHWVPEMVVLAGGFDVLGRPGEYSRQVTWEEIQHSAPEVVIAMPCGFGLERTRNEIARVPLPDAWHQLPGVRNDRVFAVDGSAYFNRPGPRLVDGVEILAALLHPDLGIETPAQSWSHVPQPVRR